jgi:hypothetical protein
MLKRAFAAAKPILTIAAMLFVVLATQGYGQVLISEFMARNDDTLIDGDGNYSDWIELYNTGSNAVDLTGWFLSDDTNDLQRWSFPATNIAAEGYLVVFASGQDATNYVDSLGYLHTTFKLDGDGENVLLVRPDGVTVAHAVEDYPPQSDDVSYGLEQESAFETLIVERQDAKAFIGTSEPAAAWNTLGFNDASWLNGSTGVGFEQDGSVYSGLINLDVSDMFRQTFSVYIRIAFDVTDPAALSLLTLRMKYDDGFVAYINGTEIASANAPASPNSTSQANGTHNGTAYEDFSPPDPSAYLQAGANVLAIHALDYPSPPPDLFIMPLLTGIGGGALLTNSVAYLSTPTPGAANVTGVHGYVDDTKFSVDRGFFTNAFETAISCSTEGAAIYYTTDGSTPTEANGVLYVNPVAITRTTVLRAAAFKAGYQPSDVDTQTYLFVDEIVNQPATAPTPDWPAPGGGGGPGSSQAIDYEMDPDVLNDGRYNGLVDDALLDLPSISLVTDLDNLFDGSSGIYMNPQQDGIAWERPASVELLNPDGSDGFQAHCGLRIRGGSSRQPQNPKHSFRMFFRAEYGDAKLDFPLFGDEGDDNFDKMDLRTGQNFSWNVQNRGQYATWLYDIFTRDVHRAMDQPYARGHYYHLYLNGVYWGLFQTDERPESNFGESYFGGADEDYDAVKSGDYQVMEATDGTIDAYSNLWAEVNAGVANDADYFRVQGMNADGERNPAYTRLLDVDNLIDYMIVVFFTADRDRPLGPPSPSPTQPRNLFAVYNRADPDGFKFVPHDAEHSLEIQEGVNNDRVNLALESQLNDWDRCSPWWIHLKLMSNDEYKLHFADHVHRHFFNGGILTPAACTNTFLARAAEIEEAVIAESARWGDYLSPTSPRTKDDDWQTAVDWLVNNYFTASPKTRTEIVLDQFSGRGWYPTVAAPVFSQHGGGFSGSLSLTMTGSSQVYYTLDGSDPREVGTGNAVGTPGSSVSLTRSTHVKARVLSGSTWSALTEATFVLDTTSPLRVTEIMYNAALPAGVGTNYTSADFEFIELLNTGTETIGLAGTAFGEGIYFDFTDGGIATLGAGEYVVLVSEREAFAVCYTNGETGRVAGAYRGRFHNPRGTLANGGEAITLTDGLGRTIQRFTYDDGYDITDGEGFSLTLMDPTADTNTWNDGAAWRPSAYSGGTPGSGPVDFPAPGDLVINEALTHQDQDDPGDWIELHNTSTNAIGVNGWYLSDDEDNLEKVRLTGLSAVPSGGYLVLTEHDHFGTGVAGTNGFALHEHGEEIYLSSAEGGELTGYRLEVPFGAADRDVTFGRHAKSDGAADFTAQSAATSGSSNAYPRVGPVVITELLYDPASNAYEFIELCNRATTNVPLYDSAHPTNTWKLDGAVEFTFPQGISLAPGSCIVVAETNAAAFTNVYAVPAGVTVLGPYDGKLDNAGEDVTVTRPGEPEAVTGAVPYIVQELVEYDNESPWPTEANTGGVSLVRVDATLYANDPANWTTSSNVSPGTVGGPANPDADGDGMPDDWETLHFGGTDETNGGSRDDWDGDGASNLDEWSAGTNPTNAASVFAVTAISLAPDCVISWLSASGKVYSLWTSSNSPLPDTRIQSSIPATPPINTITTSQGEAQSTFYRLTIER